MKTWMSIAVGIGLTIAVPAVAGTSMTLQQQQLAATTGRTAADLATTMGRSIDTARTLPAEANAIETRVAEALERDIIESSATAPVVLEALSLTLAAQRCTLVDRQQGTWNRTGCAALSDLLATVTTALGGPAAAGPTGGIAGVATGAPPVSAAGSDYADD